jgi:PadR family transcriptional regulator PadR
MNPSQKGISGVEISRSTGMASGTLYPILFRLERAGWVQSEWEDVNPSEEKRPRKRLYRMTALGHTNSYAAFQDVAPGWRVPAWS